MIHGNLPFLLCLLLFFLVEVDGAGRDRNSTDHGSLCTASERSSLLKLKEGFIDPTNLLSSWAGDDCCRWMGVGCDNMTGNVVHLNLRCPFIATDEYPYTPRPSTECLHGEIHPSLADLKHLQYLDLSFNIFNETNGIPAFIASLPGLEYLNLSNSGFTGRIPPQLGNLSALQTLDIAGYSLFSEDLGWISSLHSLQYLGIHHANLSKATATPDWMRAFNVLSSLSTLHLVDCNIQTIPRQPTHLLNLSSSLITLDLSENRINSTFPTWLFFNLSALQVADLGINSFHGAIPESFVGDLCNLRKIYLSWNSLRGHVTKILGDPSKCIRQHKLEVLQISNNELSGNLSPAVGTFRNLRVLDLGMNNVEGTVPESIGQLSQLQVLDFLGNNLTGTLSRSHFANLTRLKSLQLNSNPLAFDVSQDWIPPFQLEELYLSHCHLGPNFPLWLQKLPHLRYLFLANVGIADVIPLTFWNTNLSSHIEILILSNNNIRGRLPQSLSFSRLSMLDLRSNRLEGSFPNVSSPVLDMMFMSNNSFSGPLPPDIGFALPRLSQILLYQNGLTGSIPRSICEMRQLAKLDMSHNQLSGTIPDCWKAGSILSFMNFGNNNLSGRIPNSISLLARLNLLQLDNNYLSGDLPSSMKNCGLLTTLDLGENKLSGGIPTWIGTSLPFLAHLRLRSNMLQGDIPRELASLFRLQTLDLAYNLLSGSIPKSFGNFPYMKLKDNDSWMFLNTSNPGDMQVSTKGREYSFGRMLLWVTGIDLSSNRLSGEIPEEITELYGLRILNLSGNHLSGFIPERIGNLKVIESLDLSRNQLSGPIPSSMATLSFLAHLNVSHNNLSDKIPTGNQLQSFNYPSIYEGNPNLCGPPLTRKCGNKETDRTPIYPTLYDNEDDVDGDEMLWFYLSMTLGFVVGFWIVCGGLLLKKSWRISYYGFLEKIYDRLYVEIALKVAKLKLHLKNGAHC